MAYKETQPFPYPTHLADEDGTVEIQRSVYLDCSPEEAVAAILEAAVGLDNPTVNVTSQWDVEVLEVSGRRLGTAAEIEAGEKKRAEWRMVAVAKAKATLAEFDG